MKQRLIVLAVASMMVFAGASSGIAAQSRLVVTEQAQPAMNVTALVRAFILNLRSSPGVRFIPRVGSNRIGILRLGTRLAVFGRDRTARWLKIRTGAGKIGWVAAQWIRLAGTRLMALPIVP